MSAFMVAGGFVGYFIGKFAIPKSLYSLPGDYLVIAFCAIIPIFFIVIAWHEGGHALAGVKVDFDFRMYVVGPFMWEKDSTGWHFKWNKNVNTAGGLVLCLPKNEIDLARRFSIFATAGPIASLVLTLLSYAIYALLDSNNAEASLPKVLLITTAVLSFLIFIMTAIPLNIGGFYTDGARVLRLRKGGDTTRFELLMLKTIAATSSGVRPKLLNISELEEINEIANRTNEPFGVYIHGIMHQAAFDNGDLENAEKHLQNYIDNAAKIPDGIRNMVWLDAAFFYAFGMKNLERAEHFWQQFKPAPMLAKAQIYATEASLSLLRNEPENVSTKIALATKELPNMIDKGLAVVLEEKLNSMKTMIL